VSQVNEYVLEIDPEPQLIPTARMFAATVARQHGYPEESVLDLKIAVSEACTNAVNAHRTSGVESVVRVAAMTNGQDLRYEITDAGKGFDYEPEDPSAVFRRAAEDAADVPGMGLALIRTLFPSVEVQRESEGTIVRFALTR
jgi:serine/threonine-protein kinase RsbW